MTRLLWVTAEVPDLEGGGGSIRQASLLPVVAEHLDVELVVAGRLSDARCRAAAGAVVEVEVPAAQHPTGRWGRRVDDLRTAVIARAMPEVRLHEHVRRALAPVVHARAREADLVLVHHHALAPLLPGARRDAAWVLHLFNLGAARAEDARAVLAGRQRWLAAREAANAARLEAWAARAYDGVVVVSERDRSALAALGAVPVIAPNGVTVDTAPAPVPADPVVLFSGTLDYLPNVDGITWFANAVWPDVVRACPEARLVIAGRNPVPAVRALAGPSVEVRADVAAMAPLIARARLVVVPVRIGTGTRLKALQALGAGRPVVGTSIGLEGLGLRDGVDARIADDPAALAAAVLDVLRDDELASRLAEQGRRHAAEHFDWRAIGAQLAHDLAAMAR